MISLTDQEISDLVLGWTSRLVLFARRWTNLPDDAVQQAFYNLCCLQSKPDDVVAWMFKATRNAAIDILRTETMRARRESASALPDWFEPNMESRLDGETLTEKLQELPPELCEIVIARIWGELTFEQIAASTETSKTKTHRLYNDAIAILRNRLNIKEISDA